MITPIRYKKIRKEACRIDLSHIQANVPENKLIEAGTQIDDDIDDEIPISENFKTIEDKIFENEKLRSELARNPHNRYSHIKYGQIYNSNYFLFIESTTLCYPESSKHSFNPSKILHNSEKFELGKKDLTQKKSRKSSIPQIDIKLEALDNFVRGKHHKNLSIEDERQFQSLYIKP